MKKLIKDKEAELSAFQSKAAIARRYYKNENDILSAKNPLDKVGRSNDDNPLRNADNRISHGWHPLLLNQKASYAMSIPPRFDVDDGQKDLTFFEKFKQIFSSKKGKVKDDSINNDILKLLGNSYFKVAKDLCVDAGNTGISWVHVWRDNVDGFFRYSQVESTQIIPIYSNRLGVKTLEAVLRVYETLNEQSERIVVYEYWNDVGCWAFSKKMDDGSKLNEYRIFDIIDKSTDAKIDDSNFITHEWGRVPFIPFRNNNQEMSDLDAIKRLVDVYDKVYSGFVNDLDDVQEIIFVLTNYGGEDKREFLEDLKKYKMVKIDSDGDGEKSGIDTLAIDIPIEARVKILEMTRESIFVLGQGVDPQKNISQNNSGVALKQIYSLLELKCSMLETEFREGFAELIKFILIYLGEDPDVIIEQTWTRTSINNDLEKADIISKLSTVTSKSAIAKSNPLVSDWQEEIMELNQELTEDFRMEDDYKPVTNPIVDDDDE